MFGTVVAALILLTSGISGIVGNVDWGNHQSSYLSAKENYVLEGYLLDSQWTFGLLSCAQRCLIRQGCLSVNYEARPNQEQGLCEFNNYSAKMEGVLTYKDGCVYAEVFHVEVLQYIFTTLKTAGRDGPTSTSGYVNTLLEGMVQLDKGIQIWAIPYTGTYTIETFGASGRNGTTQNSIVWRLGGMGARMKGTFYLKKGTKLKILVGQQGTWTGMGKDQPGSGGGGSFVTLLDNTPLIIAGGGGGGSPTGSAGFTDGDPGQATGNGTRYGGSKGGGGRLYNTDNASFCSSSPICGTGSGLLSQGCSIPGIGEPSLSFVDGGRGGWFITGDGGFGGGGYGVLQGGGGGGYSGGGVLGNDTSGTAGGGGSLNSGLAQDNMAGVNKGEGRVVVTLVEREV